MTCETLKLDLDDGLLWIRLNRPEQMNAFTPAMADELEAVFRSASLDDAVTVIVVTGEGRAFCAGMDLSAQGNVFGLDEALDPTLAELEAGFDDPVLIKGVRDTGGRVALAIHDCRKPVIAAINGAAVGVGATLTLAMDFRMASTAARIGFVFNKIGIVPEACSTWFLPRLVGLQQALEWSCTGDIFKADEGLRAGLLRSVHEPDALLADVETFARRLVTHRSAAAIAMTRQMMRRNPALPEPKQAHLIESLAMFHASQGDGKEGVRAFLDKRDPRFVAPASPLPAFAETWLGASASRNGP